jgi:light-regulated signal transduction histidine kinase (bacteriophytochrome)
LRAGGEFSVEHRFRRADGVYRWFLSRSLPVKDEAGRVVKWFGTATDIEDAKRAEAEIKRLNEDLERRVVERTAQLEAANKELEAFSYSVSHDLRAPLRAMDGFSRILLEDHAAQLDPEGQRLLDVIRENARWMGQLIEDLLAFSRVSRKEPERGRVDMRALAEQVIAELTAASGGVSYDITLGDLPPALGDARLIRQALYNLLANAFKFSRTQPRPSVSLTAERGAAGEWVYCVRDNGVGFDPRYAAKLFNVFQRLHGQDEFEGTGVGLAIVQRIIQRHGGRVWAAGEIDCGAAFYFTLPCAE